MKLAEQVKNLIETKCFDCFSLYAGYGMTNGEYVRFPTGVQISEKRNNEGRCVSSLYQYADGSKLSYRFNSASDRYNINILEN